MFTPWNEICLKKYRSHVIPVVPLWQTTCNQSCAIPLGPAPWKLYPARNVDTNCLIEVECFNLLTDELFEIFTRAFGPEGTFESDG